MGEKAEENEAQMKNLERKGKKKLEIDYQPQPQWPPTQILIKDVHIENFNYAGHRQMQEVFEYGMKAAARAGVRGAESKLINALASEISALEVEREKERRYFRDQLRHIAQEKKKKAEEGGKNPDPASVREAALMLINALESENYALKVEKEKERRYFRDQQRHAAQQEKLAAKKKLKQAPPPPPEIVIMDVYIENSDCARDLRNCLKGVDGVELVIADRFEGKVVVKGAKAYAPELVDIVKKYRFEVHRLLFPNPKKSEIDVQIVIMEVQFYCDGGAEKVRNCLREVNGVEHVIADVDEKKVVVVKRPKVTPRELVDKVDKAGFKVRLLSTIPKQPVSRRDRCGETTSKQLSRGPV